ncbi:MAG TPA: ATP-binding protein [Candidatus Eisenbergiella merdavium]|uniref:ATP-binding protein n=1 Tax=Candidatus Eisenbergiella merdavium TaxID=2838551 RepID=A0A9D2NI59_9FIRM|nr:ATP-binding protein [Candidatus Eisenbergiella merdavium]
MFIGREQELKKLNRMYQSGRLEVAIIYGRRRVGKTTLINEFCRDKKTIFFAAQESSAQQNLENLSCAVSEAADGKSAVSVTYRSFADAVLKIAEMASSERLIWVIDEYPYLAQAERGISSLLQNFLDHQLKETRLFLILCGSSMSFMENQVLGYQSPLYGRRTAQFKLLPFDYLDTGKWFPDYSCTDKALIYGITGGIPMYLEQFSPGLSIRENLLENLFDRNAVLFEEPSNLLKQELREPAVYNAVITAIASGKTKLSEIATTVGVETGLCAKYMSNLISLGIIKRETPVTDPNSKRPVYLIEDQFFRFWYSFVPKNISAIQSGRMERSYPSMVEERLPDYMGLTFEKMCRDYILYYDEKLPFPIGAVGQWWGGNPKTRRQAQIDIVVTSAGDDSAVIGSCKYRESLVGEEELRLMEEYAEAMGHFRRRYYYLFSRSGFSTALKERAREGQVRLITLEELYESGRVD